MTAGSQNMPPRQSGFQRIAARLLGRVRNDSGIAAVEFSLILPILVLLWIGGVEVTEALSVDRRINNLASSIGDLVARSKQISEAEMTKIFDLGPKAMYPSCDIAGKPTCASRGLSMRITAVNMDGANPANGSVAWSRASGFTKYTTADNNKMNTLVPQALRVQNTQVIMAEVEYYYKPAIGYVITGSAGKKLTDVMFFVPRLSTQVQLCDAGPPYTGCPANP
jgi:Flp pilus assembly protein TadG